MNYNIFQCSLTALILTVVFAYWGLCDSFVLSLFVNWSYFISCLFAYRFYGYLFYFTGYNPTQSIYFVAQIVPASAPEGSGSRLIALWLQWRQWAGGGTTEQVNQVGSWCNEPREWWRGLNWHRGSEDAERKENLKGVQVANGLVTETDGMWYMVECVSCALFSSLLKTMESQPWRNLRSNVVSSGTDNL